MNPYNQTQKVPVRTTSNAGQSVQGMIRLLAFFYGLLVVYGSLYPFSGWSAPAQPLFYFLAAPIPDHLSRADILTNVLAYIPLGTLLVGSFRARWAVFSVVMATFAGTMLSFTMESVQMFLPARTSSNIDLLTNVIGTLAGAIIGLALRKETLFSVNWRRRREEWFETGVASDLALFSIVVWVASQLCPFVPSMDVSSIREGLSPVKATLLTPGSFLALKCASYGLNFTGLGLLAMVVARRGVRPAFLALAGSILLLKPLIVTRQLSLESLCGLGLAAILLAIAPQKRSAQTLLAMFCVLSGFVVSELYSLAGGGLHPFNWIPLAGQLDDTVSGLGSILDTIWPFMALASLAILGFGRKRGAALSFGAIFLSLAFILEWVQTGIEGRYGDITTVLLAGAGWFLPWLYFFLAQPQPERISSAARHRSHRHSRASATDGNPRRVESQPAGIRDSI